MSFNGFGHLFRVTTWGESHGPALGCVVDGCPPGVALSEADIQPWLDARRPGQNRYHHPAAGGRRGRASCRASSRGVTTGTPISLMIGNTDQRSKDYGDIAAKLPARARRPHLSPEVRPARLPRRRAVERARDGGAGGGGGRGAGGAGGAGARGADPRRAWCRWATRRIDRARLGLGRGRRATRSGARTPARRRTGRSISTGCARTTTRSAR